jgi:hypothetical protein
MSTFAGPHFLDEPIDALDGNQSEISYDPALDDYQSEISYDPALDDFQTEISYDPDLDDFQPEITHDLDEWVAMHEIRVLEDDVLSQHSTQLGLSFDAADF